MAVGTFYFNVECRQHTISITNRGLLSFPTKLVTLAGLEPATSSFVARRSKFRLSYNAIKVSVMSDSNRRPSPWQGDALPTELMTQKEARVGFEPTDDRATATDGFQDRCNKPALPPRHILVGMAGFGPAASCSRSKRSTRLSYIPKFG